MAKLSGELIRTLDILPNTELDEVVKYIDTIKKERKVEKAEDYKNALTQIFFSMLTDGFTNIKFADFYVAEASDFDLNTIETIDIK